MWLLLYRLKHSEATIFMYFKCISSILEKIAFYSKDNILFCGSQVAS